MVALSLWHTGLSRGQATPDPRPFLYQVENRRRAKSWLNKRQPGREDKSGRQKKQMFLAAKSWPEQTEQRNGDLQVQDRKWEVATVSEQVPPGPADLGFLSGIQNALSYHSAGDSHVSLSGIFMPVTPAK